MTLISRKKLSGNYNALSTSRVNCSGEYEKHLDEFNEGASTRLVIAIGGRSFNIASRLRVCSRPRPPEPTRTLHQNSWINEINASALREASNLLFKVSEEILRNTEDVAETFSKVYLDTIDYTVASDEVIDDLSDSSL